MKDKGLEQLCDTLDKCINKLRSLSNSADAPGYNAKYVDWLSTNGEKRHYRNGAIYAGFTDKIPKEIKTKIGKVENKTYCVIYAL